MSNTLNINSQTNHFTKKKKKVEAESTHKYNKQRVLIRLITGLSLYIMHQKLSAKEDIA